MIESLSKLVLVGYFVLFVAVGLLYRTWVVYKLTAVNALSQTQDDRTLKVLAIVFKVHLFLALALVVDFTAGWGGLSSHRFAWVPADLAGVAGSVLLVLCFAAIVISQHQMRDSWRIEIDPDNRTELVTGGVFEFSRNPIFFALRVSYFAMFLVIPCPLSLFVLVLGDAAFQFQVRKEEQFLRAAHGTAYADYAARVRRWI